LRWLRLAPRPACWRDFGASASPAPCFAAGRERKNKKENKKSAQGRKAEEKNVENGLL